MRSRATLRKMTTAEILKGMHNNASVFQRQYDMIPDDVNQHASFCQAIANGLKRTLGKEYRLLESWVALTSSHAPPVLHQCIRAAQPVGARTRRRRESKCMDCAVSVYKRKGDYYMVRSVLWNALVPENEGRGMLCWACLEKRAQRPLTMRDLSQCVLNRQRYFEWLKGRRRHPMRQASMTQIYRHVRYYMS